MLAKRRTRHTAGLPANILVLRGLMWILVIAKLFMARLAGVLHFLHRRIEVAGAEGLGIGGDYQLTGR